MSGSGKGVSVFFFAAEKGGVARAKGGGPERKRRSIPQSARADGDGMRVCAHAREIPIVFFTNFFDACLFY